MGISTKHAQKTAKPSIIQLSLKSGKYQLLCFPKNKQHSTLWVCTFNFSPCTNKTKHGGNANTHSHAWAHRKTLLDSGACCIHEKASVIYSTCTHIHTLHTHGQPLPNPLPLTRVQQSESYVPPLASLLVIVGWLQPQPRRCLAQEPPGKHTSKPPVRLAGWPFASTENWYER